MSSEEREIMTALGRTSLDGNVKGTHLGQILTYCKQQKQESVKITLSKLALICGMAKRQIRENYFEGLEAFGIIKILNLQNDVFWKWIGISALERQNNGSENPEESLKDYVGRKKSEKK